jgi:hypothetical protein
MPLASTNQPPGPTTMATPAQQHRRGEKRGRGRRPPWPAVVGPWPALACRGLPWPAVARVSWSWPAAAVRLHPQPSSTAGHRLCLHRWIRRSRSLQTRRCRLRTPPADAPLPGPHTPHPPPHRRPPCRATHRSGRSRARFEASSHRSRRDGPRRQDLGSRDGRALHAATDPGEQRPRRRRP